MAKVLVVGGAGYVGSATCAHLLDQNHEVWILDDLSTGHSELILSPHFVYGKAGDVHLLRALFKAHQFDCVFHFAARNIVSESVLKRDEYFENNVTQTQVLLDEWVRAYQNSGKKNAPPRFVFSSTCAIFGDVGQKTIHESLPIQPLNPYGETKAKVEEMLKNFYSKLGVNSVALRYFNASGADPSNRVGEWHEPETHLIPRIFQEIKAGSPISIFGDDYATPDGTCIRDYIHVTDLARAHVAAMDFLFQNEGFFEFNLGSQKGYSVKEVIAEAEKVLTKKIETSLQPRRAGDAVRLVADSSKAKKILGFQPQYSLTDILKSAWEWEQKRTQIKPHQAVFLDRDETLNPDPGYINDENKLHLYPWVAPLIAKLKKQGFKVFTVSNQSGIGRGKITFEQLAQINLRLNRLLFEQSHISLDAMTACPHHPDENCDCRKPKPKLILDLATKFNLDLAQSYMVGDRDSDYEAGVNAGCKKSFKIIAGDQVGFTRVVESILKNE